MQFSHISLIAALLATSALAAPPQHFEKRARGINQRVQRRATHNHRPNARKESSVHGFANDTGDISYSGNWAGAIASPLNNQSFNAVSATFVVPTPSVPIDPVVNASSFAGSAWVGIDGDAWSTAILQTGVDWSVDVYGDISYSAWYEWFPAPSYGFNMTISAGDVISVSVYAATSKSGSATIENISTGQLVSTELSSTYALGGLNAEWIVEDFSSGGLVPFAGTVLFFKPLWILY